MMGFSANNGSRSQEQLGITTNIAANSPFSSTASLSSSRRSGCLRHTTTLATSWNPSGKGCLTTSLRLAAARLRDVQALVRWPLLPPARPCHHHQRRRHCGPYRLPSSKHTPRPSRANYNLSFRRGVLDHATLMRRNIQDCETCSHVNFMELIQSPQPKRPNHGASGRGISPHHQHRPRQPSCRASRDERLRWLRA